MLLLVKRHLDSILGILTDIERERPVWRSLDKDSQGGEGIARHGRRQDLASAAALVGFHERAVRTQAAKLREDADRLRAGARRRKGRKQKGDGMETADSGNPAREAFE